MDDRELLGEFVDKAAAGAFEALVGRYLSMVYGVAMREVREHHLAEDVTQAVFALLAKKAGELRSGTVVAGWLFQTARYAARNAKKMERRRRFHEDRAGRLHLQNAHNVEDPEERSLLLDGALARLGERDRGAVILRYYRRLEMAEIGKALGVSEGAARRRVERAVVKLRVVMGTAEGGGIVGTMGVVGAGMPAGIAARSLACAKGDAGFETVQTLMKGALKMMFWAKMKVAAVAVAAVMVVSGAGTLTVRQLSAHEKETAPVAATNPLEAMYRQLDQLTQMVRNQQESIDKFCNENSIPRFREAILHEYDRLARLNTSLDDAELHVAELKRSVDGANLKLDAAMRDYATLQQKRDDLEKKLRDLDRSYSKYEEMAAQLKALQAERTKLWVKVMVAQAKA